MTKRLLLIAGALLLAMASGGWRQGIPITNPSIPTYANWREALAEISCEKIVKDGKRLKVIGPVVVDGKSYQDHTITGEEEIEAVEKRCSLKG